MKKNITTFCDVILSSEGFNYTSGHAESRGCEPTWYTQSWTVLGNGMSLVRDFCESGISLVLRCDESRERFEYIFQVTNRTAPPDLTPPPTNNTLTTDNNGGGLHFFWLLLLVPVPVLVLVLVLCRVFKNQVCRPRADGAAVGNSANPTTLEEVEPLNCHADGVPNTNGVAEMIPMTPMTRKNEEKGDTQPQNGHVSNTPNTNGVAVSIPVNAMTLQEEEKIEAQPLNDHVCNSPSRNGGDTDGLNGVTGVKEHHAEEQGRGASSE